MKNDSLEDDEKTAVQRSRFRYDIAAAAIFAIVVLAVCLFGRWLSANGTELPADDALYQQALKANKHPQVHDRKTTSKAFKGDIKVGSYYFTRNVYQSAWSTANATSNFNDGSPGDSSTGILNTTASTANLTCYFDLGVLGTLTAWQFTYFRSSGFSGTGTFILEGSNDTTTWTTIEGPTSVGTISATPTLHSWTGTATSYRYYRLSLRQSPSNTFIEISDWRLTFAPTSNVQRHDMTGGFKERMGGGMMFERRRRQQLRLRAT